MCENCKYALIDEKRVVCMSENSDCQYEYVSRFYVCDEYESIEEKT